MADESPDASSDQHRHECEVRYTVKLFESKTADERKAYMDKIIEKRGPDAAQRLRFAVWTAMKEAK